MPSGHFPCPNPACHGAIFTSSANLNKHFGKKPACRHHAMCLLANWKQASLDSAHRPTTTGTVPPLDTMSVDVEEDKSMESSDHNFYVADTGDHMSDYHDENFFGLDDDDSSIPPGYETTYTKTQQTEIYLLKLCTELEAPLYAFEEIMKWARKAYIQGYQFIPRQSTYRSQIDKLEKWMGLEALRPEEVEITLPGLEQDDTIKVTRFDFTTQLRSLLDDPVLNRDENLVLNPDDRFQKYSPPDGRLGECISGSWYQHAWDEMVSDGICDFMIPNIFYIDKTQLSISGKLSIHPVQMSLGIFTEKCRRSAYAWRPLGYIANENVFYSSEELNENTPDGKCLCLHKILDCILESFKAAQVPGALNNSLVRLGKESKVVNLYVPLQYIIGDVEGGDDLCSRQRYRGKACPRLCRTCDIPTEDCARTDIDCTRIRVADVKALFIAQDLEALKLLAQRPTYNTFYDIDCGKDPYGIFSMIHTEGLHALEMGVMKYMVEILMDDLPKKQKRTLDRHIKKINRYPHQKGYAKFPRCTWSEGVTSLSKLTGDQRVGKLFAILLVAHTHAGEKFFTKYLPGGERTWKRLCYCFSMILCYWAWLKQDHYWLVGDDAACQAATNSIKTMMRQLQNLWPREKGLGLLLTKIHEQFHVPVDIVRNGKPANYHTGPPEHNHIPIKDAAKKNQMQKHKIDLQTGERIVDRLILQRAFDRVNETVVAMDEELDYLESLEAGTEANENLPNGVVANASKGTVTLAQRQLDNRSRKRQRPQHRSKITWKTTRSGTILSPILYQSHVLAFLEDLFLSDHGIDSENADGHTIRSLDLECFTEYERNGFVYRCHPLYRKEKAYYDWCMINWNENGAVIPYIGRIHLFVRTPDGEIMAVVQSVDTKTREDHGIFGDYWYMDHTGPLNNQVPKFEIVEVDALADHVMVIPYNLGEKRYIHVHDRDTWPSKFTTAVPPAGVFEEYHT